MTAKLRHLDRQFAAICQTQYKNLLVSGCSFTWNNSEEHICSWPYYLRDLAGFESVLDCSQSGAGNTHVFNSIVNEIETNSAVDPAETLVVIMWSGLTRTDVIAEQDVTGSWHNISNYHFDDQYATLSLFNSTNGSTQLDQLCRLYKQIVQVDAQVYESLIRMIALRAYLDQRGFQSVMTSWKDPRLELEHTSIATAMIESALTTLNTTIQYLDAYAVLNGLQEPCGHPTPDGYLGWTQDCLIPNLKSKGLVI